ncbi:hypothetical protein RQP46_007032 [Phenoliferia psychrophenolica]
MLVRPGHALVFASFVIPALAQTYPQPNVCFRWSGQMAIANSASGGNSTSTLYYQGGEASLTSGQTSGLWTNALVALDLSTNWPTGTPAISLVTADTGNTSSPPAVALGALWASSDGNSLYQYGGEFSDTPDVAPPVQAIWRYSIQNKTWGIVPTTGDTITRAAEGSTAVVPSGGTSDNMGYYFSGHEDDHTTHGWSNEIARIYLNSLVTFDLGSHAVTNITSYATDASTSNDSTPEINPVYRADGTFTFVPGLGTNGKGLLVAIGGATSSAYVDNSVLDVYDIGASGWTKQSTLGTTLPPRVNHCAVRASAKVHGVETHQIFVYGGQELNQTSRDSAMYILSIPSYTWVFVGDNLSGQPSGRAGHQCALHGSQLLVVGGLVAGNLICDQPGIYVYDVSKSAWQNEFTANSIYSTPSLVANITGGIGTGYSSSGSGSATGGDGSTDPDTSGSTTGDSGSLQPSSGSKKKSNIGAIVGGVVGGVLGALLLLLLLLFCLRKRRRERKLQEAAAAAAARGDPDELAGFPYEKTSSGSQYNWRASGGTSNDHSTPASDDVEDEMRNMEAAFGAHMVRKRTLRVTNPENGEEEDAAGDDHIVESLMDGQSSGTPTP